MSEGLQFVSELQQKVVLERVETLVNRLQPDSVICYGLRTTVQNRWSLSSTEQENVVITAVDLLAIVPDKESDNKTLASITNVSDEFLDVSTIVHTVESIKSAIAEGSRFFPSLLTRGVRLYGKNPLFESSHTQTVKTDATPDSIGAKMTLSRAFLDAAVKCTAEARNAAAMFLIHQSVEAAYAAVLNACLGYRSITHNLNRLARISDNITPELRKIFPCSTAQERHLFAELNRAYYAARYATPYIVPTDAVSILIERSQAILLLSQTLCAAQANYDDADRTEFKDIIEVPDFDKMVVDVPSDIVLQPGSANGMRFSINENGSPIRWKVTNRCLTISVRPGFSQFLPGMTIFITYKSLRGLNILQSGNLSIAGTLKADRFGLVQSGKGLVKLDVDINFLDATISKTANLELTGRARTAKFLNAGNGHLNAAALQATEAEVRLTSSGKIAVYVEKELNLKVEKSAHSPSMRSMVIS